MSYSPYLLTFGLETISDIKTGNTHTPPYWHLDVVLYINLYWSIYIVTELLVEIFIEIS